MGTWAGAIATELVMITTSLADQRNHQRRGAAGCGSGAAALGRGANDPVLIAEATFMEALLGD